MEEPSSNKLRNIITLVVFVLLVVIVFFYLTSGLKTNEEDSKLEEISIKLDQNKEYIYYENEDPITNELIAKEIKININTAAAKDLTTKLNHVNLNNKSTLQTTTNEEDKLICANSIRRINFQDYSYYENSTYLSLVVFDYLYECPSDGYAMNPSSYIFDLKTGTIVNYKDILKKYNMTFQMVDDIIRNSLINTQQEITLNDETQSDLIKITETIANLEYNHTYTIYINEENDLMINFIVKTSLVDYNETINLSKENEND